MADACSGIRSLTACLFAGSFLGSVFFVVGGGGVFQSVGCREIHPHFVADGGGDEPLRLDLLPRGVEPFGADETEDVALAAVAALPTILINQTSANFYFGGTSLLIVIGVALDTMKQLEAQLMMRNYEGFLK